MFKKNLKQARSRSLFFITCLAASVANAADNTTYPDAAASNRSEERRVGKECPV